MSKIMKRLSFLAVAFALVVTAIGGNDANARGTDIWFHDGPYTEHFTGLDVNGRCNNLWNSHENCGTKFYACDDDGDGVEDETCQCQKRRIYNNKCDDLPWWTQGDCYNTMYQHHVHWWNSCPKGQIRHTSARNHVNLKARYIGHGNTYDTPGYVNYENNVTPDVLLECVPTDAVSVPGVITSEMSADFGPTNPANKSIFSFMGCSERHAGGQWNPTYGANAMTGSDAFGKSPPVPTSCLGSVANPSAVTIAYECRPQGCNMATLEGCDMPQGYYEFFVEVVGLRGPITCTGEEPPECPYPAFKTSDTRYCGDTGCRNDDPAQSCKNFPNDYYEGITIHDDPIPEQRLFISSVAVEYWQPQEYIDAAGNKVVNRRVEMLQDFSGGGDFGVASVSFGSASDVYFPDEIPASNGVLVFRGSNGNFQRVGVGSTKHMVRSMACPKRFEGYIPLQNVTLGQTELISMEDFNEDDIMTTYRPDDGKVGVVKHSCELVEDLAEELPDYNILSDGQYGFGVAHSTSTAVNQLLDDLEDPENQIPVLTVAISEPAYDCITSNAESFTAPDEDEASIVIGGSFYGTSETKWGSHDNAPNGGRPGAMSSNGRLQVVQCLQNTFSQGYHDALKDAAKRVKDAGGYVVAVALSCKSAGFEDTMMDMSTGGVNVLNFAPEGVFIGGCRTEVGDASGNTKLVDGQIRGSQVFLMDVDESDTLFFNPVYAQGAEEPLYGTLEDVYAEIAWVIMRNKIGKEVCANQAEGVCDDAIND